MSRSGSHRRRGCSRSGSPPQGEEEATAEQNTHGEDSAPVGEAQGQSRRGSVCQEIRLTGELKEPGRKKGTHQKLRFIGCKELPPGVPQKDVFILPSAAPEVFEWRTGSIVKFTLWLEQDSQRPQAADVELVHAQQEGKGTGPRGRSGRPGEPPMTKERIEEFINLNGLDDKAAKTMRDISPEAQAAILKGGFQIDLAPNSALNTSAVVMGRLKKYRGQQRAEGKRQPVRGRRPDRPGDQSGPGRFLPPPPPPVPLRSRSRSRSPRSGSPGFSASRSASRSFSQDSHRDPRGEDSRHHSGYGTESSHQHRNPGHDPAASNLLEVRNLPDWHGKSMPLERFLTELLNPQLANLPDFSSGKGAAVSQVWFKDNMTLIVEMQSAVLSESASRVLNGLEMFGKNLQVRLLSDHEASSAMGRDR